MAVSWLVSSSKVNTSYTYPTAGGVVSTVTATETAVELCPAKFVAVTSVA